MRNRSGLLRQLPGLSIAGAWRLPSRLNMVEQALRQPEEALAIVDLTGSVRHDVSFARLRHLSECLARALAEKGVGRGDRVGVFLGQGTWCAAAHLAIWWLGAISVPLFKLFRHDALAARIEDSGLSVTLTDDEGVDLITDLAEPVVAEKAGCDGASLPVARTGPDDPAILIYTSGTTGRPKGVLHGHRLLTGHLPGVVLSHNYLGQKGDCLWTPADWAWIGGLFDVLMPGLALGVPVVAARLPGFSPEAAECVIRQGDVRNVFFPPTALRMLKAANQVLPGLRSVASGGEPLGTGILDWGRQAFQLEINEFYGQTECNMIVSNCAAEYSTLPGTIGKPVPGHEVAVIGDDGVPAAGEGEIAVRRGSTSMMLEYWKRPQATAGKFRNDWMLTGDRGVTVGDRIRFLGREDDVITSSGYRIGPAEIEDCLLAHPSVATVGAVGKPDPLRTEIVKAYVVLRPGKSATEAELQTWVRARLSNHSYPREVAFLKCLPMTVTGKVIRRELRRRAAEEGCSG